MGRQISHAIARLAVVWGIAWSAMVALMGAGLWLSGFSRVAAATHQSFLWFALMMVVQGFAMGAIAGVAFALMLAATERRRTVGSLKMWRVASWGALGGIVLAGAMIAFLPTGQGLPSILDLLSYSAVLGGLGAGSAATSLRIARRVPIQAKVEVVQLAAP